MLRGPDTDGLARACREAAGGAPSSTRAASARSTDLTRRSPAALPTSTGVIVGKALYERRFTVAEAQAALGEDGRVSVLKRVIPCLDVDKGRVVKGTNFVGLRDAGDPVELAERYDAEGADELVFLDITASHEAARHDRAAGAAHGGQRLHPVHDRRRHPLARGRAGGARRRRRQGLGELGGGRAARS